jgi:hypothetical protein
MHLPFEAQVCVGCGLPFEVEVAQAAPGAPTGPITYEPVPDNPWRAGENQHDVQVPHVPAEQYAQFAPVEEPAPVAAEPVAPPVPAYEPPALGTPIALTFADPLPPLPTPTGPPAYDAPPVSSTASAIPVAVPETAENAARVAVADDDLGVPAAYAPFAPETAAAEAPVPAEIVPLIPATGLTIAPPAVSTPGWNDGPGEAAAL